jgi:ATP-dependent DNA ligase
LYPQQPTHKAFCAAAAVVIVIEPIVSRRLGSSYRTGRSPHWVKVKNPKAPAVKLEAKEDWGNKQWSRARRRASY